MKGEQVKSVILIIDGASGWPASALKGRTTLEAAHTPRLDELARCGTVGMVLHVPEGMEPSSAVACMSVMGFDPREHYAGRGPIEAAAMGLDLEPGQVALRCNLVTVAEGRLVSYSAGGITSAEAAELVAALQAELGDERVAFHPGVGFRHILTVRQGEELVATRFTPAHDLSDRPLAEGRPEGPGADYALELMERSKAVLADHPVNRARLTQGKLPATQIWLFWPGMRNTGMPDFAASHGGLRAALTSPVDLLRGLALLSGIEVLAIPGVTDGDDNDYAGQMAGALAALDEHDLVFVHVEAPDEAAHRGDAAAKVRALEQVDELMIPQLLAYAQSGMSGIVGAGEGGSRLRVLVLPDHPTPLELKTHVAEAVPFVMWGPGFEPNGAVCYTEAAARATGLSVAPGHLLLSRFLG